VGAPEPGAHGCRTERPDERGHVPMMRPAAGPNPTVDCPIRRIHPKAPDKVRPNVRDENVPEAPDQICTQGTVDFGPEDGIRDAQLFRYQSKEWSDAYRVGRNTDESYHAYVKSAGHEALDVAMKPISLERLSANEVRFLIESGAFTAEEWAETSAAVDRGSLQVGVTGGWLLARPSCRHHAAKSPQTVSAD
jgi:hypothetical protein